MIWTLALTGAVCLGFAYGRAIGSERMHNEAVWMLEHGALAGPWRS